jgi:sulfonate transport system substrate-binding protein
VQFGQFEIDLADQGGFVSPAAPTLRSEIGGIRLAQYPVERRESRGLAQFVRLRVRDRAGERQIKPQIERGSGVVLISRKTVDEPRETGRKIFYDRDCLAVGVAIGPDTRVSQVNSYRFFRVDGPFELFALSGVSHAADSKELKVRIGYQPGYVSVPVAFEEGFLKEEFEKDGVFFEPVLFTSGPPIIEAIAAGEIDFGFTGDQPAIQAAANDVKLKAIAISHATERGLGLIATPNSGIAKLEDVKGKKIAYTVGSVGHQLLINYITSIGLTTDDLELFNLSPGDIIASLQSGHVDGSVTWEPYISQAISQGIAKKIIDATGYKYIVDVISVRTDFADKNQEVVARFLKVYDKAASWSKGHEEETLKDVAKLTGVDADTLRASFELRDFEVILDKKRLDSIEASIAFSFKNGLIPEQYPLDKLVDLQYLKAAGLQ